MDTQFLIHKPVFITTEYAKLHIPEGAYVSIHACRDIVMECMYTEMYHYAFLLYGSVHKLWFGSSAQLKEI